MNNKNRLLCYHMLSNKQCKYGKLCTYAHKLEDQILDENKQILLDIYKKNNLKNIPINNSEVKITLLQMTSLCPNCILHQCSGGYNCKKGAFTYDMLICYDDLMYGNCNNNIYDNKFKIYNSIEINKKRCCNGIHLTYYNMAPLYKTNNNYDIDSDIDDNFDTLSDISSQSDKEILEEF